MQCRAHDSFGKISVKVALSCEAIREIEKGCLFMASHIVVADFRFHPLLSFASARSSVSQSVFMAFSLCTAYEHTASLRLSTPRVGLRVTRFFSDSIRQLGTSKLSSEFVHQCCSNISETWRLMPPPAWQAGRRTGGRAVVTRSGSHTSSPQNASLGSSFSNDSSGGGAAVAGASVGENYWKHATPAGCVRKPTEGVSE